jgi:hypothetical protein
MCVTDIHKVVERVNKSSHKILVIDMIEILCKQLNIDLQYLRYLIKLDYFHTHPQSISYDELLKFGEKVHESNLILKQVIRMVSGLDTTNLNLKFVNIRVYSQSKR